MSVTRANATTYLENRFSELRTAAGMLATDSATGWGPPIDDAFRALGKTEDQLATATATDAQRDDFLALLRYCGLARLRQALAVKVDVSVGDPDTSVKRSQMVAVVAAMLKEAKAEVEAKGYGEAADQWGVGNLRLGYSAYDPDEEEAGDV